MPVCGVDCRRKKRDTSSGQSRTDEDLLPADAIVPLEAVEVPGPEGLHPNDTWPTASGITLDAATSNCRSPILSLSIFSICDNYTLTTRPAIINSCVLDIQVRYRCIRSVQVDSHRHIDCNSTLALKMPSIYVDLSSATLVCS